MGPIKASTLLLGFALGLRHGVDPEHLAVIDGVSRVRSSPWNGVLFGLGHGLVVMTLAIGVGDLHLSLAEALSPWLLIAIGVANLWRLVRPAHSHHTTSWISASPLLLGALFAAGFESATQLSALVLVDRNNTVLLGLVSSLGTLLIAGVDGFWASRTQSRALSGSPRAALAARLLGIMVVISSFALAATQLLGMSLMVWALPVGIVMFGAVVALRIWGAAGHTPRERPLASNSSASDSATRASAATLSNVGNG